MLSLFAEYRPTTWEDVAFIAVCMVGGCLSLWIISRTADLD